MNRFLLFLEGRSAECRGASKHGRAADDKNTQRLLARSLSQLVDELRIAPSFIRNDNDQHWLSRSPSRAEFVHGRLDRRKRSFFVPAGLAHLAERGLHLGLDARDCSATRTCRGRQAALVRNVGQALR